jgi:nicotinamidase-related amidase
MSIKCLTGEDKGMEARYTTTSAGGKRGVQTLAVAIAEQVDKDQSKPVPVVLLKKEHYQHKSYGRIFTPLFDIQSWVSMDGEEPAIAEVEEVAEAAPARRRRSAT